MFQAYIEELHTLCADSVGVEFDYIVNTYICSSPWQDYLNIHTFQDESDKVENLPYMLKLDNLCN